MSNMAGNPAFTPQTPSTLDDREPTNAFNGGLFFSAEHNAFIDRRNNWPAGTTLGLYQMDSELCKAARRIIRAHVPGSPPAFEETDPPSYATSPASGIGRGSITPQRPLRRQFGMQNLLGRNGGSPRPVRRGVRASPTAIGAILGPFAQQESGLHARSTVRRVGPPVRRPGHVAMASVMGAPRGNPAPHNDAFTDSPSWLEDGEEEDDVDYEIDELSQLPSTASYRSPFRSPGSGFGTGLMRNADARQSQHPVVQGARVERRSARAFGSRVRNAARRQIERFSRTGRRRTE